MAVKASKKQGAKLSRAAQQRLVEMRALRFAREMLALFWQDYDQKRRERRQLKR